MTALPSSGSFTMVDPTHVAALGPAAAMVFARIEWRCKATGEWQATRADIAGETGLSMAMIRTALDRLREHEWIDARRTSVLDSTLIWSPIHAGQAERSNPLSRDGEMAPAPEADSAFSSLETGKDNNTRLLRAVDDAPEDPVARPEVVALCQRLADRIVANGSKPPTITKAWLDACRLLIDKDERTPAQVATAIDWCQADAFWRANILSMPTLRKQYDKLRLAALREREGGRPRAMIPAPDEAYDPAHEATLPPPPPRNMYA